MPRGLESVYLSPSYQYILRQVSAQYSLVEGNTVKTMAASLVAVSAVTATAGKTPWLATGGCNDVKGKESIERLPKLCIYIVV